MMQTLQAHPGKVQRACCERFNTDLSSLNLQRILWSIRTKEFSSICLHGFLNLAWPLRISLLYHALDALVSGLQLNWRFVCE